MNPLVSIIIPVLNREKHIAETLDSVSVQDYKNWECIIVDDGSTDRSLQIIKEYCKRNSNFKFYQRPVNKKKGAAACRNFGLEIARGKLIQFLDSDDLLAKNKINEQVKLYDPSRLEIFTCKWGGFTDKKDLNSRFKFRYQSYYDFRRGIDLLNTFGLFNEFFPLHVYLTPVKLISRAGFWNEELTNNDDAEFFTRILLNAASIRFAPETAVYYRYNSENKLSTIDSPAKVTSLLYSLDLIDWEIKRRYKYNRGYYVKRAKSNLYNVLKRSEKDFIMDLDLLKNAKNDYDSFFFQIRKKIIQLLK